MSYLNKEIEQWGIYEVSMKGPETGNPFLEIQLEGTFKFQDRVVKASGFYDGHGNYIIRFMPDAIGEWSYVTSSNCLSLTGKTGKFTCIPPSEGNHGPVRVHDKYHFAYADGTQYYQIGTTCYVWNHQGDKMEEQTLATLKTAPFNKMRMCVFPKDYAYNKNEPVYHPFELAESGKWDFTRFNPDFFRHLEKRVADLMNLGIEADIILFHPYDRWGYSKMDSATDDRYLRYVVSRLSAYRNIWWSMANEFDLMESKTMDDWDRFFQIVQENDPYNHLRSVHNCRKFYDHTKPWVTHASIQHSDLNRVREWRQQYNKPIVVDECRYEGNIEQGWGHITPHEMVHKFWLGTIGGGYVGHGETYLHPEDILWWSKGGVLHGQSPSRIAFLKKIISEGPAKGFDPFDNRSASKNDEYILYYLGMDQPARYSMRLPEGRTYKAEIIHVWDMTITPVEGTFSGQVRISLPGKPGTAIRMIKIT